jgi:hypothetical protein
MDNSELNNYNSNYFHNMDLTQIIEIIKMQQIQKDKEFKEELSKCKIFYENLSNKKDQELLLEFEKQTKQVTHLRRKNLEYELEIQELKQRVENYSPNLLNNQSNFQYSSQIKYEDADKQFFANLKFIKDQSENKQREINDKYEKSFKTLTKEIKSHISNIKAMAFENKNKLLKMTEEELNEDENFIHLSQIEPAFTQLELQQKNLFEELKNKDKYILIVDQKYEMVCEENKLLKRKTQEEKNELLKFISKIQKEKSIEHNQIIEKFQNEIQTRKENIEKEIQENLNNSQLIITQLVREKEIAIDEMNIMKLHIEQMKKDLTYSRTEKEDMEMYIKGKDKEITDMKIRFQNHENEVNKLREEKNVSIKLYEEANIRVQNIQVELTKLQTERNFALESMEREIQKVDDKYKAENSKLKKELIACEENLRKEKTTCLDFKSANERLTIRDKELNQHITKLTTEKDMQKIELNKLQVNDKTYSDSIKENNNSIERLNNDKEALNEELNKCQNDLRNVKEKIAETDSLLKSSNAELIRLQQDKENLVKSLDETNKELQSFINKYESEKLNRNIEAKRFETENKQMGQYNLKLKEVENHYNEISAKIASIFRTYVNKASQLQIYINPENEKTESKMLEEIELGVQNMVKIAENSTNYKKLQQDNLLKEEELKVLKKKVTQLTSLNQLTGQSSANSSSQSQNNSASSLFKNIEKDKNSSLYEVLLIHIKNLNLKHLLEVFQLNVQREQDIRNIISNGQDKNTTNLLKTIDANLKELSKNFDQFKSFCEKTFHEYENRASYFVGNEEYATRLNESKGSSHETIDMLLNALMGYKVDFNDAIVFKIPFNDYNELIEAISGRLEEFNKKMDIYINNTKKKGEDVEKARDLLIKQTYTDPEVVNKIMALV